MTCLKSLWLCAAAVCVATLAICGLPFAAEPRAPKGTSSVAAREVSVVIKPDGATIENGFLSWNMALAEGRARTSAIANRRTGLATALEGDDFALELEDGTKLSSGEFRVEKAVQETGESGAMRLVVLLDGGGLRVRLVTEMRPSEWWATRRLEIAGGSGGLAAVSLAQWRCAGARGASSAGKAEDSLGYPNGCGQPVYADDLFFGIAHPGAENFAVGGRISCGIPAYDKLGGDSPVVTRDLIVGAGEAGAGRRAFLGYIDATRAVPARMVFLVNDWYWKDKSRPLENLRELARVKKDSGAPIDSFTLDDGWDFDWDSETGIWGRLGRRRFPGGWPALQEAGRAADIGVSLWFGPIGGYDVRPKRVAFARTMGYEINGDKLCLAGARYRRHVIESFSNWAKLGMDYIKVDGFWPNCQQKDHGHPVGRGGAIAQMDGLFGVFAAWRQARPNLLIGYTSGSNPSPFWLQHADYTWRGGADDAHAGTGEPFDRHNTFLDGCLQRHRDTGMPMSAFVTFDVVQHRIAGNSDAGFERGVWWLAARTSLHHDWYCQASDLTLAQWKTLARAADWAKQHEKVFRWSRMVGGDPQKGDIYGFSAFDGGAGVLALRNPSDKPRALDGSLAQWLDLPAAASAKSFKLKGVFGAVQPLERTRAAGAPLRVELPPFAIAVLEVGE